MEDYNRLEESTMVVSSTLAHMKVASSKLVDSCMTVVGSKSACTHTWEGNSTPVESSTLEERNKLEESKLAHSRSAPNSCTMVVSSMLEERSR